MRIVITEEAATRYELAEVLRHIAAKLEDGFTSGYYPHWSIEGDVFVTGDRVTDKEDHG